MERRSQFNMSCPEQVGKIFQFPFLGKTSLPGRNLHPVAQNWVHWLVINIPATVPSIEEGASRRKMSPGSVELKDSFGDIGYGGPQPPKGTGDHPYVFTLYALSVEKLNLGVNTSLSSFKKTLEGKILGSATLTGKYGR
jgi:Raf kinase inhibitor-like YbhB/YbcL family protein